MIGTTVRQYHVLEQLGQGGMGVVYRAHDTRLERDVALKFLPAQFSHDEQAKARFMREARAASGLDHPNICTIHEIGEADDGRLFLAMPLYDGQTMKDRLEAGPLDVPTALGIAYQVAGGLERSHEAGIVHRDVKPANVMITSRGRAVVLDFGVAKLEASSDLTKMGSTVGTTAYMSPEQARGDAVDARSDVWSLGVVLYEMVAGRRPFTGSYEQAIVYAIINQDPDDLDSVASRLPDGAGDLLKSMLAKDPDRRPASMAEVVTALAPFAGASAATAERTSSGRTAPSRATAPARAPGDAAARPSSRPRWLIPVGGALVTAVVMAAIWFMVPRGAGEEDGLPPDLVAVMPFAVNGDESLAYLREGLVNLIGTRLDGAGPLTVVDPNAVIGSSESFGAEAITPDEARGVAESLGAGSFVLGSITTLAGQIQLAADFYGPDDTVRVRVTVDGEDHLPKGVDEVALQLVKSRLKAGTEALSTAAAGNTVSYEALKAYLKGEEYFRTLDYDKAHDAFKEAIAADSTFALAWYRLARAVRWGGGDYTTSALFRARREALDHALAGRSELPERFQMLIEAADAFEKGDVNRARELYQRRLERDPNDVEALSEYADLTYAYNPLVGKSSQEAVPVFERLLAIDADNGTALWNLAMLAGQRDDLAAFDSIMGRLLDNPRAQNGNSDFARQFRVLAAHGVDSLDAALGRVSNVENHVTLANLLAGFTHRYDVARAIGERLAKGDYTEQTRRNGRWIQSVLASVEGRPKASDALAEDDPGRDFGRLLVDRVMRDAVPQFAAPRERLEKLKAMTEAWDTTTQHLDPHSVIEGHYGEIRAYLLGILAVRLGDDAGLARQIAYLRSRSGATSPGEPPYVFARTLEGLKDWRNGQLDAALASFDNAQMYVNDVCASCSNAHSQTLNRFVRAEILFEQGRHEDALGWYGSLFDGDQWWGAVHLGISTVRSAEIAEAAGNTAEAVRLYGKFLDLWKNAEPELQPLVEDARRRMDQLVAAGSREPGRTVTPGG